MRVYKYEGRQGVLETIVIILHQIRAMFCMGLVSASWISQISLNFPRVGTGRNTTAGTIGLVLIFLLFRAYPIELLQGVKRGLDEIQCACCRALNDVNIWPKTFELSHWRPYIYITLHDTHSRQGPYKWNGIPA